MAARTTILLYRLATSYNATFLFYWNFSHPYLTVTTLVHSPVAASPLSYHTDKTKRLGTCCTHESNLRVAHAIGCEVSHPANSNDPISDTERWTCWITTELCDNHLAMFVTQVWGSAFLEDVSLDTRSTLFRSSNSAMMTIKSFRFVTGILLQWQLVANEQLKRWSPFSISPRADRSNSRGLAVPELRVKLPVWDITTPQVDTQVRTLYLWTPVPPVHAMQPLMATSKKL